MSGDGEYAVADMDCEYDVFSGACRNLMKLSRQYDRGFAGLLAVWGLCLVASCLVLSFFIHSLDNSLYKNGNWTVSKTRVVRRPMLAFEFLLSRRTLSRNMLNLGAWSSSNEVVYKEPFVLSRMQADVFLPEPGVKFFCVFSKTEKGLNAVELSAGKDNEVLILVADKNGKFLSRSSFGTSSITSGWHSVELVLDGAVLRVSIDGQELGQTAELSNVSGFCGFRGATANVRVDNIVLESPEGVLVDEDFSNPDSVALLFVLFLLGAVALNVIFVLCMHFVFKRDFKNIIFSGLSINFLALAVLMLFFSADYFFLSGRAFIYPQSGPTGARDLRRFEKDADSDRNLRRILDREMDYLFEYQMDNVRKRLEKRYRDTKAENEVRIIFLGSSQTWGEGVNREDETFVVLAEKKLNQTVSDKKIVCINAGIAGFTAERALEFYKDNAAWLKPDICIINFGNNLSSSDLVYRNALTDLCRINKEMGVEPVLVQEACIPEPDKPGPYYRTHTQAVAQKTVTTVWDLHEYMFSCVEKGFIWWDHVHLSACGHEFASAFFDEKIKQLLTEKNKEN